MKDRIRRTGIRKVEKKFRKNCIVVTFISVFFSVLLSYVAFELSNQNHMISSRIENVGQQINYFQNQNNKVSDKYKKN